MVCVGDDWAEGTWRGGDPRCPHPAATRVDGARCRPCGALWVDAQYGLESTVEQYVARLVAVFDEAQRVLTPTGTLWLNLGDSYAGGARRAYDTGSGITATRPARHPQAVAAAAQEPDRGAVAGRVRAPGHRTLVAAQRDHLGQDQPSLPVPCVLLTGSGRWADACRPARWIGHGNCRPVAWRTEAAITVTSTKDENEPKLSSAPSTKTHPGALSAANGGAQSSHLGRTWLESYLVASLSLGT